ncbi:hypothetical protein GMORB2_3757 [Geosmithia morbida]|uniref:Uncharacterized protein n=1 Tax=Geosmithia morbida TaxID=1094350 RepID=A0A9P4Z0A7_9HYPO|nr:uncharacterized protein GMORB2_3757 [Geosmithia morbida]KAF4124918.1 hypothetical protein GMORB2_3757 [Geosmithia morbida]
MKLHASALVASVAASFAFSDSKGQSVIAPMRLKYWDSSFPILWPD